MGTTTKRDKLKKIKFLFTVCEVSHTYIQYIVCSLRKCVFIRSRLFLVIIITVYYYIGTIVEVTIDLPIVVSTTLYESVLYVLYIVFYVTIVAMNCVLYLCTLYSVVTFVFQSCGVAAKSQYWVVRLLFVADIKIIFRISQAGLLYNFLHPKCDC